MAGFIGVIYCDIEMPKSIFELEEEGQNPKEIRDIKGSE